MKLLNCKEVKPWSDINEKWKPWNIVLSTLQHFCRMPCCDVCTLQYSKTQTFTYILRPWATKMQDEFVSALKLQLCCSTFCAQGPKAKAPPPFLSAEEISLSLCSLSHTKLLLVLALAVHTYNLFCCCRFYIAAPCRFLSHSCTSLL